MILVERGKVRLSDSLSLHIPEIKGEGRERITVEHLLTHTSGYAPDFDLKERWTGHDEAIKRLIKEPLRNPPGTRFTYSDIGFIALAKSSLAPAGCRSSSLHKEHFWTTANDSTGFRQTPGQHQESRPRKNDADN